MSSILLFATLAILPAAHASIIRQVTIDTSSQSGVPAVLDFFFNGGGVPSAAITASITNFTTDGLLAASGIVAGGTVTGNLPGAVTLKNDGAEYDDSITLKNQITFTLMLSGPGVDSASGSGPGSVLVFSVFNPAFDSAYLTSDQTYGRLIELDINNRGALTATTFTNPAGGPSYAAVTSVPEPGALLLTCIGVALFARRRLR